MHSSRSSELTVYKVSHGYLQHHHHHWRHHHRRHHNQHDVHQLFQSNSILRVPTTSLSPRHAMPSFSGRDGLPLEDFRWLQLNAKIIRHLSLHSYSLSSFSMIISDDLSRIVSTGAMLLLFAFIVLQITLGSRLEVVTRLPRWCYLDDGDNCLLIYFGMSIIPPGFLVHRPTGFHLMSSQVRKCCLKSTDIMALMLKMQIPEVSEYCFGDRTRIRISFGFPEMTECA